MPKQLLPVCPETRLLRLPEVRRCVGLGRSAIYEMIKKREFPSPIKVGPRAVAWVSEEIANWIQTKIATSRNTHTCLQGA